MTRSKNNTKLTWEKHKDYVFLEYDEVGEAIYDEVTRYHCPACGKGNYKRPSRFCPDCGKELGTLN